jgi:hypothetical protein
MDEGCIPAGKKWERPGWARVEARAGLNEWCYLCGLGLNPSGFDPEGFFPIQIVLGPNKQGLMVEKLLPTSSSGGAIMV